MQIEDQADGLQKQHAKELYNTLSNYLILITEMRNKALVARDQLEEILDISSQ
jgi:hypothetical protein